MRNPLLYKKSMNGSYFSYTLFVSWLFYALIHAIILYIVAFYAILYNQSKQSDGKDFDIWLGGHLVYGCCIFMVNILILHKISNYTGWGEILVAVMIMAFFTILYLESLFNFFPQVYYLFDTMFIQPLVWLIILLIICICSTIEIAINGIKKFYFNDNHEKLIY
jgi:magnesium-transporting ATPase (P-type)